MCAEFFLSASILSADFACLGEQIHEAEQAGADWIHIDVMDGHFVPNLTMGPFIVETCRRASKLPLDVHLMVSSPEKMLADFIGAGASLLSVHVESCSNLHRTLHAIREAGCKAGVAINPGTPGLMIEPILHLVDLVLIMTVNPGYSGQSFLAEVTPKIKQVRRRLDDINPTALVEVDGGITKDTLPLVYQAGARAIVAATAIFKHPEGIAQGLKELRDCIAYP
jgi:ribulose-phosphate 3-epimerase